MIHPLIGYIQRAFYLRQMGNRILCQDCDSVGCDQFRNSVVDLRINVIRTAAENDTGTSGFCQVGKNLFSFVLNIISDLLQFFVSSCNGSVDFI